MKVPTAVVWKARKIVLSKAPEVAPLSTAYHCRSTTVCCTAAGFLRQMLPLSFETDAPISVSGPSRSVTSTLPWSSTATSVSPPPGGSSGREPIVETRWNFLPSLVERWMNDMLVEKPHGPDSQMFPSASIFTSGSPSVRCESTTAAGVNRAFQAWKLGIGKTVGALVVEPGGMIVSGGSGNSDTVTTPAESAGVK